MIGNEAGWKPLGNSVLSPLKQRPYQATDCYSKESCSSA